MHTEIPRRGLLFALATALAAGAVVCGAGPVPKDGKAEVRVGIDAGDFRGGDQRALQAAVDYVAGLGGGTVRIGAGRYAMRNSLMLRSNVRVIGELKRTALSTLKSTS